MADEGTSSPRVAKPTFDNDNRYKSRNRSLFYFLFLLLLLAGVTAVVLYLVYRPSKPQFSIVSIFVSAPTTLQPTVAIRNPNHRSTVSFNHLSMYVTDQTRLVIPPVPLPPLEQQEWSTVAFAPVLTGGLIPTDPTDRPVVLRVVVVGKLKYKPGPFRSAWNDMHVSCDVIAGIRRGVYGRVPLLGNPSCHVRT